MGEPPLESCLLETVGSTPEELPDSQSSCWWRHQGAGQGRPTKRQVGAGRREPRPDYNRNRKHSRPAQTGPGQGRTGGV